jgi:hypothetical protein
MLWRDPLGRCRPPTPRVTSSGLSQQDCYVLVQPQVETLPIPVTSLSSRSVAPTGIVHRVVLCLHVWSTTWSYDLQTLQTIAFLLLRRYEWKYL